MTFDTLLTLTLSSNILLLSVVVLIKYLISMSVSHPVKANLFSLYCQQLATKVNKPHNSRSQQKIAGWLALLITIITLDILLATFEIFIEVTWLWHGFLLYLAMGNFSAFKLSNTIVSQLKNNQNYLAKKSLQPLTLRECENLSKMGLIKACIEMQLSRALQGWLVPILLFLLISPLAALTYRMLLEMHYQWNIKQASFHAFGQPVSLLINIIQWLPARCFALLLLVLAFPSHFILCWRLCRPYFFKLNNDFLLCCLALGNTIQLGGVAKYQGQKVRRSAFNTQARQPELTDIKKANNNVLSAFVFFVTLLLVSVVTQLILNS